MAEYRSDSLTNISDLEAFRYRVKSMAEALYGTGGKPSVEEVLGKLIVDASELATRMTPKEAIAASNELSRAMHAASKNAAILFRLK